MLQKCYTNPIIPHSKKENTKVLSSTATISGVITEIYEGKNADYITVKTHTGNKYYDMIKLVDKDGVLEKYNEGDVIENIPCSISSFFDNKKKTQIITFTVCNS